MNQRLWSQVSRSRSNISTAGFGQPRRVLVSLLVLWAVFQVFCDLCDKHNIDGFGKKKNYRYQMFDVCAQFNGHIPYAWDDVVVFRRRLHRNEEDVLRLRYPRLSLLALKAKVLVGDSWEQLLPQCGYPPVSLVDSSQQVGQTIAQVWVTMATKKRTSCIFIHHDHSDVCFTNSNMI